MAKTSLKKTGKNMLCAVLEWQVVRLRKKHDMQVVAVAGSIGKTSTKLAIAHMLEGTKRVMYQTGNYNDRLTVPLVFFGRKLPGLFNVLAWLRIFIANEYTIRLREYYDIVVVELGTDGPGQMKDFAYLQPDITVVTAITPEHMEYFHTLDNVAAEELVVCDYSADVLINTDDIPAKYLDGRRVETYGLSDAADYQAAGLKTQSLKGMDVTLRLREDKPFKVRTSFLGKPGAKIVLAAAAVGNKLGLIQDEIVHGISGIKPFAGRMQLLPGIKGSTIIDDTYNASPEPVMAALDILYALQAPQRIAILGSMNELGDFSRQAHQDVGNYCDAKKLDLVITIGEEAEQFLAPAALQKGCDVHSFRDPYKAGEFVRMKLKDGAVVLAEGSQNGVFAEESLKPILLDADDAGKLVRQSGDWMKRKQRSLGLVPADYTIQNQEAV